MNNKALVLFFCLLTFVVNVHAQESSVLMRVKQSEQPDSLGYNIVEQIAKTAYKLIIEGKIKLWDSPSKEIQITGSSLQEIEKSSGTSFINQDIIFIYEKWLTTKRDIQTKTIGITFSGRDERGQEVAYGYLDYNDYIKFASSTIAEVNANGIFGESIASYIQAKKFNFNLVQVNNKVIQSVTESQNAVKILKGKLDFYSTISSLNEQGKSITYFIDAKAVSDSLASANSKSIFKMFEDYFTANKEEFYNLGGDKLQNFVGGKQKLKVTGIEVNELWKKNNDEIYYEPRTVKIFINDSALNTIANSELALMDLEINGRKFILALLDKKFNYVITQINAQKINRRDAYTYLKALQTYSWNQLTDFVKYY